ncbi:MAG TPA: class I SAM-dependent methyltransferase [Anaerolineales bacterium]|nr:class I SAM-dependent methyltransferase [Anaerolineales bacterium]
MPFGSEIALTPGLSIFERWYIRIFGVPILGLRIRARTILPLLKKVGTPRRILDAGSGRGIMTMECAKKFPQSKVIGADLLKQQNEINNLIARQLNIDNVQFMTWNVLDLHPTERFDVVISSDTLEHLEDDLGGVRMLRDTLNPGGYLIVHVPHLTRNLFGWHRQNWMDIEGHVRPGYTRASLIELLEAGGMKVIQCIYNYNSLETLANDVSKLITGAKERNRAIYALFFPFLLLIAWVGKLYRPKNDGSGLVALAIRKD